MFSRSAELYDAVYGFKDYAGEAEKLHALIQARSPGAATLLDVACGTGKHLEHLAQRYSVEGLDLDASLLAIARRRLPDVPLHQGDMADFDLGRRFDAVVCLFSSIGYVKTHENLRRAAASMAAHVAPRGVLVIEPWLLPGAWRPGGIHALFVDEEDLKAVRMNTGIPAVDGVTTLEFHYLVGTPAHVEYFTERHELALFSHDDYVGALEAAGLAVEHEAEGLIGRGLYIGRGP
jgi:SAM-dependent methyltransferase